MGLLNKKEKEKENDSTDYSKEADQSRFLIMAFCICMTVVLGLFALEFWHQGEKAMLFTPEIVHILVNGLALSFFGLGTYIYGKSVGANEAIAKMVGQNGNGGQANGQNTKETKQTNGATK